jgi:hypothetical protein
MSARIAAIRIGAQRIILDQPGVPVALELELEDAVLASAAAASPNDLVLGQKVPPKPEVQICGAIVKPIQRSDPRFATLVRHDNADIVFKNEEGTNADRMMTTALQAKLDALAASVRAEWSDRRLRVTEAWDENGEHAAGSLHYEGRAADITTDPIDNTKLGRLGRLAVDAGLDWVFYENARHVHVSVKSGPEQRSGKREP